MQRTDFHFELPPELIAQHPAASRSGSRLLTLDGISGALQDLQFCDLPGLLDAGDLLIFNDTRVIPARIFGAKDSGGRVEILLERALTTDTALVQLRVSKGLKAGARVQLPGGASATMLGRQGQLFHLRFSSGVAALFAAHGEIPLPPYIERGADAGDRERYQTVFARYDGAVAAPTAGLHFDAGLLAALKSRGVAHAFVTLHVGAGTFQPVRVDDIEGHQMHEEFVDVPQMTCDAIDATRAAGGRVIAVGTTVVRSLESAAAAAPQRLAAFRGMTKIFIRPGHRFRVIDKLITNFHLPESTLLMLCSAFVGHGPLLAAYAHAVRAKYRFFSYGDAMLLTASAAARPAP